MNIIGIDPSLTATGWAVRDGSGTTGGPAEDGDRRIVRIYTIMSIYSEGCHLAVVEDLPTHGMGAGKTGMAQGVVRLALRANGVPYVLVPAASLKKFATGKGSATKADMRMSLYQRTGDDLRDDNQVDATWLRYLGLAYYGLLPFTLPKTHMDALTKITDWPTLEGHDAA